MINKAEAAQETCMSENGFFVKKICNNKKKDARHIYLIRHVLNTRTK